MKKFVQGFFFGSLVGLGWAYLNAPDKGLITRGKLKKTINSLTDINQAQDQVKKSSNTLVKTINNSSGKISQDIKKDIFTFSNDSQESIDKIQNYIKQIQNSLKKE